MAHCRGRNARSFRRLDAYRHEANQTAILSVALRLLFWITLLSPVTAWAQDTASNPAASDASTRYVDVSECNDYRIQNDDPLTSIQRLCIYASNLLTTSAVLGAGAGAGWAQLMKNDPVEWGRGPLGYARSYGTRYAAGMSKATSEYLVAALFREDPRPRRSASPKWTDRVIDAALVLVVDTGQSAPRPAYHTLAGALASGFTGMAFYPRADNTVAAAFARSGMSLGGSLAYSEFYEFEPDLFHLIGKWFTPKLKRK
jgi:hypothetical protein